MGVLDNLKMASSDDIAFATKSLLNNDKRRAEFMDTPAGKAARGLVSDAYTGGANILEGIGTGYNNLASGMAEYIAKPIVGFFSDEQGNSMIPESFPLATVNRITEAQKKLDTTFDSVKQPLPEDSLVGGYANNLMTFVGNKINSMSDKLETGGYLTDQGFTSKIFGEEVINKLDADIDAGKTTNLTQSDVSKIMAATSQATQGTGEIANASAALTEAVTTDKKSTGFLDKLNSGIDTFLNDLDTPGFQTALAMHMEAKNGGDITSVLFEGMKVQKKAQQDLLKSHADNLKLQKVELEILSLYDKLGETDKPSKELIAGATALFSGKPYKLGDQAGGAAYAMSALAMGIKKDNPGMDDFTALQLAISTVPEGTITKDGWSPFWGGSFDPSKLFQASSSTQVVPISALQRQATAQGIDIQTALRQAEAAGITIDEMR